MRLVAAIACWLIALAVSSLVVATITVLLDMLTAPDSTMGFEPSSLVWLVLLAAQFAFLFAFIPALIVSAVWESGKVSVYAGAGLLTGVAFALTIQLLHLPPGPSTFSDHLRHYILAAVSGLLGGCVLAWQLQVYSRLLHQRETAQ